MASRVVSGARGWIQPVNHLAKSTIIWERNSSLFSKSENKFGRDLAALLDLIAKEATKLMEADRASLFCSIGNRRALVKVRPVKEIRFDARLGIAGAVA